MRIPVATYRVQFSPAFTFEAAKRISGYLSDLGISHLYASPVFKSRKGSPHGYDIVDPNRINPELGSRRGFDGLSRDLRDKGIMWMQDIVPNHMAYSGDNPMLMDVFENREQSRYFDFFDIDWVHPYESFQGRVLAPFLGKFYSEALESGEIRLSYGPGGLAVRYHELRFPVLLSTYKDVLLHGIEVLEERLGKNSPQLIQYLGVVDLFSAIGQGMEARYGQRRHAKEMLWKVYNSSREIREFVDGNIARFNGTPGDAGSFTPLDNLLSEQCYRLSFWKVASEELNYRRFFTVNEIISLRAGLDEVLDSTHQMVLRFVREGVMHALRIDHLDGLYDPTRYLDKLRRRVGDAYIVVEKILERGERLPAEWPIQGTTGYDFLNMANGVFCRCEHAREFSRIYHGFTDLHASFEQIVCDKKRLITGKHMAGDIDNLAYLMKRVSARDRYGRDISFYGLKRALVEVMAYFPVYRTYISSELFREEDRRYVTEAIERASMSAPNLVYELTFVRKFLLGGAPAGLTDEEMRLYWHAVMRFQQVTAPVMAKGYEDTVFYVYNRLLSLNEVGGDPERFGVPLEEFHEFNKARLSESPHSLNATSTHDTKRGEDARARLNVLSEIPGEWKAQLRRWSALARKVKRRRDGGYCPDANDEYLIYQALIGSAPFRPEEWDDFRSRTAEYIVKAVREAKVHTAWIKPDEEYERGCVEFVTALTDRAGDNAFLTEFLQFQRRIAFYGILNSLSQALIKITSPGVPDIYQGSELWNLSLVDPDNRRPVDFEKRMEWLGSIRRRAAEDILSLIADLLARREDGRVKMFLTWRALAERRDRAELFQEGDYIPLEAAGRFKSCVIAYARRRGEAWAVTIAPRFLTAVVNEGTLPLGEDVWGDTAVIMPADAPREWRDCLISREIGCGDRLFAGQALRHFPVALLFNK